MRYRLRNSFLNVSASTTGEALKTSFLNYLKGDLNLKFSDCWGQSYDNGANMKVKYKGTQALLLQNNPRAFFVPCCAHSLNLVVADGAKASTVAVSYFREFTVHLVDLVNGGLFSKSM